MQNNEYNQESVNSVFSSVHKKYDLMNSIMSMCLHHAWKRIFIEHLPVLPSSKKGIVIDLACGTGDIASLIKNHNVVACDINIGMIKEGMKKTADKGIIENLCWVQCNAEKLPFMSNIFDACTISFGMRNVENRDAALREIFRVLRPGGKFICMEFSQMKEGLVRGFYINYLLHVIPRIGAMVANDGDAYQYLAESILAFPNANQYADAIAAAGFSSVSYQRLAMGIVAIHSGFKLSHTE